MSWFLGIDIGGTFTDLVAYHREDQTLRRAKELTTHQDPVVGVLKVLDKADIAKSDVDSLVHGTTIAINAVLQGTGARTVLLTTQGFRDTLEMGRKSRPDMYNLFFRPRPCPIPRDQRWEVRERIAANGEVLQPLDKDHLQQLLTGLDDSVEAIAICLINSYGNPEHERVVAEMAHDAGQRYISISSDLSRERREYERTCTTVVNSYVGPLVSGYLGRLATELEQQGCDSRLLITQSNGGVMDVRSAQQQPVRTIESGPAAGVTGAAEIARRLQLDNVIAFDMGGTSAKACVVRHGQPEIVNEYSIGGQMQGLPVQVPFLDIVEVGAGGGSIAHTDGTGRLRVGPQSAGSSPGPAAYGLGGKAPTVTDANLLIGAIHSNQVLGDEIHLNLADAYRAVAGLATQLNLGVEECAREIVEVANSLMANAIRMVTVERGLDPQDFILVAYGGAGPVHASSLAAQLGIPRVLIPAGPGTFAAQGMLLTDVRHDVSQSYVAELETVTSQSLEQVFTELQRQAVNFLYQEMTLTATTAVRAVRRVDLRYRGQFHTLTVELPEGGALLTPNDISQLFHRAHEQRYGHSAPDEPVQILAVRVAVIDRSSNRFDLVPAHRSVSGRPTTAGELLVEANYKVPCSIYDVASLDVGHAILGPALIQDSTSTTLVGVGDKASVTSQGDLLIEVGVHE